MFKFKDKGLKRAGEGGQGRVRVADCSLFK